MNESTFSRIRRIIGKFIRVRYFVPKTEDVIQPRSEPFIFFLPAYVEIEVKEFSSLSVFNKVVKFRGKLTIKLSKFPPERRIPVTVTEEGKNVVEENGIFIVTYEIDKEISWTPNFNCLPFDEQHVPIPVELAGFKIGENQYYFNILNEDEEDEKEYYLPREIHVGGLEDFHLFYYQTRYKPVHDNLGRLRVEYSPQIALYFTLRRSPWNYLLTVLLPNCILQVLSIVIFYTDNIFAARLASITGLFFTMITFINSVRMRMPLIPSVTLMDGITYVGILNLGFCLIDTSLKRNNPNYESNVWRIIAIVLSSLSTLVILLFLLFRMFQYFWMRLQRLMATIRIKIFFFKGDNPSTKLTSAEKRFTEHEIALQKKTEEEIRLV